ncbi:MAG: DNA repair protein RecO [Eubacteriales bacterium]
MHLTTNALVLRGVEYKERDLILTLLSPEEGKITATARGARKKNSPLAAGVQLFAWSEFVLYQFKGRWVVKEATLVEEFSHLRFDLKKLSLATYFAQLGELLSVEELPQDELLSLVLNSYHALGRAIPIGVVKAVFELRVMGISGYAPMLEGCVVCGSPSPVLPLLDCMGGTLCCRSCGGSGMALNEETIGVMRYILSTDGKKILTFSISDTTILEKVCEHYLLSQLDQDLRSLTFYKEI